MPKPPIAIVVRRSRLARALGFGFSAVVIAYALLWHGVAAGVSALAVAVMVHAWLARRDRGEVHLRCRFDADRTWWERSDEGQQWRATPCRLVRLGPVVSAVELDGATLWIWPDSADSNTLRHFREALAHHADRA
ncbi:hypothetical protein [Salinicola rhizosphaerae]|uniref:Toxin CptA n=1 Tax=Salinicola rhizosphaerae TaxID=1443141 RepID=A0ABQ3ED96_9GAMM|nr:hypothetical protein [Salinicola rhizosphaerae]GHB27189.1 hypothetical protein GCM10009038_27320 [Salinicola rhizosphaerae]